MDNETLCETLPWAEKPVWRSVDCGPGWTDIIYSLNQELLALYPDYRVVQVKEKFGGLRYYVDGVPYRERIDHIEGCPQTQNEYGTYECTFKGECTTVESEGARLIAAAERTSFKTCEECGTTEDVTTKGPGWIRTLCPTDRKISDEKRAARLQPVAKNAEE